MQPARVDYEQVVDYFESIRRVTLNVGRCMELTDVLQSIADSICDYAAWQICWIYAMDTGGGFGEIIARQDRLHYTDKSVMQRWPLDGDVAAEALRRDEIVMIPDLRQAAEFPASQEWAKTQGIVAAVTLPLRSTDTAGRRMVLSLRSQNAVLDDPFQLAFIKAMASLISLAVSNAALLEETRAIATSSSEAAFLLISTIDAVSAGESSSAQLANLEAETSHTVLLFDGKGRVQSDGAVPALSGLTQQEWSAFVQQSKSDVFTRACAALQSGNAKIRIEVPDGPKVVARVVRFGHSGGWESLACIIAWTAAMEGPQFAAVSAATAMVLLRDRIAAESQSLLHKDVFRQILEGGITGSYEFTTRAGLAGLDVDRNYHLVVARRSQEGTSLSSDLDRSLRGVLTRWPGASMQALQGTYVLMLPANQPRPRELEVFLHSLVKVGDTGPGLIVTSAGEPLPLDRFPAGWRTCQQVLELAEKIGRSGVVCPHEFGASRFLLSVMPNADIDEFVTSTIGPLLPAHGERFSDLFLTAEAFINASGRFQQTASLLNIHVSTLRYRLNRIAEILARDFGDAETRFDVQLAIRFARLQRGTQED
jgi:sugar diacid utilization regulator